MLPGQLCRSWNLVLLGCLTAAAGCAPKQVASPVKEEPGPDLARRDNVVDVLHGVEVPDPYRWLEDDSSEEVIAWTRARNQEFFAATDGLPQRAWLYDRYQHLWRYDDESVPNPCLLSDRVLYSTKRADQDKWVMHLKEGMDGEGRVVLDPNTWAATDTLAGFYPSPDCRYAVYGVAHAGDENPVLHVLDLDTLEVLPDTFRGWRQEDVAWRHDNSGFYYAARPLKGEVPEGEEHYWHRVWFHRLGTQAEEDTLYFFDDKIKERFHGVTISEDGRWMVMYRSMFNKSEVWLKDLEADSDPVPVATGMDHEYHVDVVEGRLFITTDMDAPRWRVMTTTVDQPGKDHWTEFIPEGESTLTRLVPVAGRLYAVYQHNAATRIAVYDLEGRHLQDMKLPTMGSASVFGHWSRGPVWVQFASFAHPTTVYTYDPDENQLTLYKKSPIDIDPSNIVVEQVWYPSKDGTRVSMFLIHDKDAPRDGSVPYLLTGYGGFNISLTPYFSTVYAVWVQCGGGVAIPNLRGGGEYGRAWHEAGMREHKQNVFDDFIAAAEWLLDNQVTSRDRLAIRGGSNGGLLVAAAVTQRPDLFAAVLCAVPLADMIRYHLFGLGNIWSEEYGNADDPEMFPYLFAYSPYHNVVKGTDYPAVLVTGSANDARTAPAHARKFFAALRWADADHGTRQPILLHIQDQSGHSGAVTIDMQADQVSRHMAFLMEQIGLQVPAESSGSSSP